MRQILIIFPAVLILCFFAAKPLYAANVANSANTKNKNELIKLEKRLYYAKIMAGNTIEIHAIDAYM